MMKKNLFENKIIIKRTDHRHDLFYKLLNETLYNSTAQIILKIFKTEYILLKIMLAISVVGSIALCSYLIIQSILNYLSYEVNTKIRKVEETPTLFPQVTICSRNAFATYDGFEFLKNATDILSNPPFENDDVAYAVLFASIKAFNISNDERRKFGFSIQDVLVECKYDYVDCTIDDFVPTYDKFHGNCFIFNSGFNSSIQKVDLKTSSFIGKKGGFTVTLKIKLDENLKDVYSDNGYTIRIDNSSYSFGSDDWIDLLTGFETNVIVDRYYTNQLPTPYSKCIVQNDSQYDSDLFKLFYNSNYTYKQEQCIDLCYQKLVIAECNCTDFESFSLFDVEPCDIEKINCSNDVYHYKFHLDNYINGKCLPLCPLGKLYEKSARAQAFNII